MHGHVYLEIIPPYITTLVEISQMGHKGIISILFVLFFGGNADAQLHRSKSSGPLKLHSIPVGDLFNHSLPLDMSVDSNDIIWIDI